jgi:hypothetical protein
LLQKSPIFSTKIVKICDRELTSPFVHKIDPSIEAKISILVFLFQISVFQAGGRGHQELQVHVRPTEQKTEDLAGTPGEALHWSEASLFYIFSALGVTFGPSG